MGTRGRLLAVGLTAFLFSGCAKLFGPPQNYSWENFTSKQGKFSVTFYGTPTESTLTVQTAVGPITATTFTVESSKGAQCVAYSDFPVSLVQQGNLARMFDGARDGAIANVGGSLVEETKISLLGARGREFLVKIKNDVFGRNRFYLVKNRLYHLQVMGDRKYVDSKTAEIFLDSFVFH
jgi:hypothetical protein